MDFLDLKLENVNPGHEIVKLYLFYERWRRAEVENSEPYLASLKAASVCLASSFFFIQDPKIIIFYRSVMCSLSQGIVCPCLYVPHLILIDFFCCST